MITEYEYQGHRSTSSTPQRLLGQKSAGHYDVCGYNIRVQLQGAQPRLFGAADFDFAIL